MMMLQVKGITDAGLKPRKMKKIAVLGGGLMGSGIATASALAGMDVIIKEVNDKFLQVCSLLSVVLCRSAVIVRHILAYAVIHVWLVLFTQLCVVQTCCASCL